MTSVLVVDDESLVRSSLKRLLRLGGYDTTVVESYDQALQCLNAEPFDVLLTDLRMAGRDGLELVESVHAFWPATRPILMSAYASARDSQQALNLGAVRVLCKPFTNEELLEAVHQAVDCTDGFVGTVHGLSLIDLLQMFHYSQRSLVIHVLGEPPSSISLNKGQLVDARCGEFSGEEAFGKVLTLPAGGLRTAPLELFEQTINREFQAMLLDHLRQLDEKTRDKATAVISERAEALSQSQSSQTSKASASASISQASLSAQQPLDEACRHVLSVVSGAVVCTLVNLKTGQLLGASKHSGFASGTSQLLSAATRELFRGAAVVQIENLVRQQKGDDDDAQHYVQEIHLSTMHTHHFAKTLAGDQVAVMLVTDRTTNLAMGWVQLRSALPRLESEVYRLAELT